MATSTDIKQRLNNIVDSAVDTFETKRGDSSYDASCFLKAARAMVQEAYNLGVNGLAKIGKPGADITLAPEGDEDPAANQGKDEPSSPAIP